MSPYPVGKSRNGRRHAANEPKDREVGEGRPATPKGWLASLAVLAGCLVVYCFTLYPSVPGGDAGELIAAGYHLEIAHPPGYPLYTLLAGLFTHIPFGSIAWRANLLSAVCDAGAAALITATVVAATGSAISAIAAGAMFAFSPLVWTYAVGAEVFPLNSLFAALLLLLALRWSQTRDRRLAYAIAAGIGLGLANHQTLVFYALPVAAWLLWTGRDELVRPKRLAIVALAGLAGLSLYLYLPLAARHATTLSWGDPSTISGFLDQVLRRDYGTFSLAAGSSASALFTTQLGLYARHTLDATLIAGTALALFGAIAVLTQRLAPSAAVRSWGALLVACYASYVVGFHLLANLPVGDPLYREVTARFWQQADVAVFVALGLGAAALVARTPVAARRAVVALVLALPLAQLVLRLPAHDRSDDRIVAQYGRALLEPLPHDSLLIVSGDLISNVTRYLQACEGLRTDVTVLDQELMTKPWYVARAAHLHPGIAFPGRVYHPGIEGGFSMRAFLDANAEVGPVLVYPGWKEGDTSLDGVYELWPVGLASQAVRVAAHRRIERSVQLSEAGLRRLDAYGWPPIDRYAPGTWERVVLEDVWQATERRGWWLLTEAIENGDDALLDPARTSLERAASNRPDPPYYVYKNLGILYQRLSARNPALREQEMRAWRRYLELAPAGDPGRQTIADAVDTADER